MRFKEYITESTVEVVNGKLVTNKSGKHIPGDFDCRNNQLTSLEGAPSSVGGNFYCDHNQLASLAGAPQSVGGHFYCSSNQLTSLEGIHKQIHKMSGEFRATSNPLESHVLGLLLIKGITRIQLGISEVDTILNKYLGQGRAGVLGAQSELIEIGLDEFAKL